jgi:MATE family multidrug resistance protein
LHWWLEDSRAHLKLAWPLCLGQAGQQVMALVDSAMVGHFDRVALAGLGVANTLLLTLTFFGVGIILGLDALIPQALGRGEHGQARALYRSGLRVALIVGVPLTVAGTLAPLLLEPCGVQVDVAQEASLYLYGRLPSILPFLIFTASSSYLQAIGKTRPIVLAVVLGNVVNLATDALLVFGDAALERVGLPAIGMPALGGLGASLSTCIVVLFMSAYLAVAVYGHKIEAAGRATKELTAKIFRLGLPVGLQLLAEVGIFAIVGVSAGVLGALPGAAHQLALTLASVPFSFAVGMGAAAAVRVGNAVGRGNHHDARRAGFVATSWGAAIMVFIGIFFVIIPEPLVRIFTNDIAVIQACVPLLAITALFQLSDATQAVLAGALRGAGHTKASLVANVIGHYGVGVWLALGLGLVLDMGAAGLWWGLAAGLTTTAIILAIQFWRLTNKPIAQS